jgi:hypothetical protein
MAKHVTPSLTKKFGMAMTAGVLMPRLTTVSAFFNNFTAPIYVSSRTSQPDYGLFANAEESIYGH